MKQTKPQITLEMHSFSPILHAPPCSLHCNLHSNPRSLKLPPLFVSIKNPKNPHFKILSSLIIHPTSTCDNKIHEHAYTNLPFFNQFNTPNGASSPNKQHPESPNRENNEEDEEFETSRRKGIFTNMWWVDLKAAVGQRINMEGIVSSLAVVVRDSHLALPHVKVKDIRSIDWAELYRRGFKGVVFDKDNTITVPYTLKLWSPLEESLEQCKSVFGSDIAVFSNSAGLREYDHDGSKARALEKAIGIAVIRHRVKKPAGTAEEIENHFGCDSSELIMVGDRPFTDVVYGNRNGFLTILTEPLSLSQEPFIVRQVRKLEVALTNHWFRRGLKPISHRLLPDPMLCVKEPIRE